jgi:hypothetical protein
MVTIRNLYRNGYNLPSLYSETASGGLAGVYHQRDSDDIH